MAHCVLLADAHLGLSDGMRNLLATMFDSVLMVGDEASLFEGARRLQNELAVVDLGLSRRGGMDMVRRLRDRFPAMKLIIISAHDQATLSRSALAAGADGFVAKRAIATDLLAAADAVLAGCQFVSSNVDTSLHGEAP